VIIAVYGVLDELHQQLIPGRSCDINDWIADMIGVSIGLIILKLFLKKKLNPQVN
jgi:VanZ family protein